MISIHLQTKQPKMITKTDTFLTDIMEGLSANPKTLPSKYFYDENGDKLFHEITHQPEYYLTCAENEILQSKCREILTHFDNKKGVRIIEPGAGDGFKTRALIDCVIQSGQPVYYNPIDISPNVLDILCRSILHYFPKIECEPMVCDYFTTDIKIKDDGIPRLMLFLGSTIGNYSQDQAVTLLKRFSAILKSDDFFLLGVDLVKEPFRILSAYHDKKGITAQFNYNLLKRINRELGADFVIDNFLHYPVYNPVLQQAESYLLSKKIQTITIKAAGESYEFNAWEPILTEISRKYTTDVIVQMADSAKMVVVENYFDKNSDFCCSLLQKKVAK